jgi:hypothetical protein
MPDARGLIRAATALPLAVVRRVPGGGTVAGLVERALPGPDGAQERRAVELFEATHRRRRTVTEAAARELRRASAPQR